MIIKAVLNDLKMHEMTEDAFYLGPWITVAVSPLLTWAPLYMLSWARHSGPTLHLVTVEIILVSMINTYCFYWGNRYESAVILC